MNLIMWVSIQGVIFTEPDIWLPITSIHYNDIFPQTLQTLVIMNFNCTERWKGYEWQNSKNHKK